VLAAYLALAVYVSFYLRSSIGYRTWRALHYASFAVFVAASFHGLFAGSDGGAVWARGLYAAAASAVALAIAYRLLRGIDRQPVWAWAPRAGDMSAVRVMLAVAALTLGVLLPMATLALPRSGVGARGPWGERTAQGGGCVGARGPKDGAWQSVHLLRPSSS
jgi:nitroreductase